MGSIIVYDYKLHKWVPYVSDPNKWYQLILDLRNGYVQPDHLGRYMVGSGTKYRKLKEIEDQKRVVNLVSPIAQATEMAQSKMKRERKKEDSKKRNKPFISPLQRKNVYRGFRATSLSTYDFSTLYTTLPHNLIKEKLINLIEWTFKWEGSPYIACNERQAFFTSEDTKRYKLWSCQNVCEALIYLLDNIYIRFGTKLYRQIVGIPIGTNCAPLVADLFLFCYERDFMTSLSDIKQAEIIETFKSTSRYLDDLLNIDNPYFEGMVNRIYPPELQLNKANTSDTEAPFLDLHLSISNGFVSSKIYDKRDDFDFDIVNFPFLDGDVPRSTSYGIYISQLIRFARVSSHVVDFNARNKSLTAKLLQQGYRYHKLRKTFSKFYLRHYELVSKFNVGLKSLLQQGLSEPEFYGDLVYKFKKIVGRTDFSDQIRKIIVRYKRIGYNINIMQQSACLVFNPITVNNFASLFNCTPVGRASDSMMAPT